MTHIYVLTNHKGGVGKSTSATNIAFGISAILQQIGASNSRVLLIDTDSQSHATLVTTGRNDFGVKDSLYAVLTAEKSKAAHVLLDVIAPSHWSENLHVLPATPLLEQAEKELQVAPGAPYRLKDPLAKIADRYAAIVIDTRPSFSLLTEMALVASTDVIIPVEPRYLETVGLMSVMQKINDIRDGWRIQNLHIGGILVTKMDRRVTGHHNMLEDIEAHPALGKMVLGVIPMNEAVSYAHRYHQSVFVQDPDAPASLAYAQLAVRLVKNARGV